MCGLLPCPVFGEEHDRGGVENPSGSGMGGGDAAAAGEVADRAGCEAEGAGGRTGAHDCHMTAIVHGNTLRRKDSGGFSDASG